MPQPVPLLSNLSICLPVTTDKLLRQLTHMHPFFKICPPCFGLSLYLSHSLLTEPFPPSLSCSLITTSPSPPPPLSFLLSPVHSNVSLELPPLDTSEGSIQDDDRACIPLFFPFLSSLPFSLLRMADYRSLHGLSGADRRLSWREREGERDRDGE